MTDPIERVCSAIGPMLEELPESTVRLVVRAAIAAMRTPTPEMIEAGNEAAKTDGECIREIYQAMIDEALK